MWDEGKKNKSTTTTRRRAPRVHIPMQKVQAEIQVDSSKEVVPAKVLLNDLSLTGVGLFTEAPLPISDYVSLVIEYPRHLYVKGKVIWCTPYTFDTKIITQEHYPYRAGIKFIFDNEQEQKNVQEYIESIKPAET
jgi:Tfp pilus assembly protein PilZ